MQEDRGSAYLYEKNVLGGWDEIRKIVSSDRAMNDAFGASVPISGNHAVAGARLEDEDISGEISGTRVKVN